MFYGDWAQRIGVRPSPKFDKYIAIKCLKIKKGLKTFLLKVWNIRPRYENKTNEHTDKWTNEHKKSIQHSYVKKIHIGKRLIIV